VTVRRPGPGPASAQHRPRRPPGLAPRPGPPARQDRCTAADAL